MTIKNAPSQLQPPLTRLGRHLRWQDGLRLAVRSWGPALLLSSLIQLSARYWPLPDRHLWAALPLEIWLIGVSLYTLLRPLPLTQVARRLDKNLHLKDRLATALELEAWNPTSLKKNTHPPYNLPAFQLTDALAIAQRLTWRDLPWQLPRRPLWLAGALFTLTLALAFLPNPMDAILAQQAAIQAAAEKQAEAIEAARQELEKSTDPTSEERAEALRALAELMKELAANPGDLEQALADLAAAQAKLRELQDPNSAARQRAAEQIAERLTALARGETNKTSDLSEAGSALTELAAALSGMDAASQAELAEALENMAAQAAATDAELAEALLDMANATRAGDMTGALRAAGSAQGALAQANQSADLQQALAAAQAQLENSRQQLAQQGALAQGQGQGQGQNQGQGQGQGQQAGNGGGSSANQLPGSNRTGAAGDPTQPNKPTGLSDLDTVYAPGSGQQLVGDSEFVSGQESGDGQTVIREEQSPQAGTTNPSLVPYRDVYQNYANAAAEAIEQEHIPLEMRDLVRDYFSQLAPE